MNKPLEIINVENRRDKIKTKEELIELLKKYKTILNTPIHDYLNALIHLDIELTKNYISDEARESLSELDIYKEVSKYNIYNRAINLLKKEESNIGKLNIQDKNNNLLISNEELNIRLFEFFYRDDVIAKNPFNNVKSNNIGIISLFQTLESTNLNYEDIKNVEEALKKTQTKVNPYGLYTNHTTSKTLSYNWEANRKQEIREYKVFLENAKNPQKSTQKCLKEIELTAYIHELLNNEFGLDENSYKTTEIELENADYSRHCVKSMDKLVLHKTLIKKMPNLLIKDNIKYI